MKLRFISFFIRNNKNQKNKIHSDKNFMNKSE